MLMNKLQLSKRNKQPDSPSPFMSQRTTYDIQKMPTTFSTYYKNSLRNHSNKKINTGVNGSAFNSMRKSSKIQSIEIIKEKFKPYSPRTQ